MLDKEVLYVTRIHDLPEMWVDPTIPVFNQEKHKETCAKNRRRRKKRKRK